MVGLTAAVIGAQTYQYVQKGLSLSCLILIDQAKHI